MELIPTQEEVLKVLRETGALRKGHFEYPSGLHSEEYLNPALALRYYQHARTLGVGSQPEGSRAYGTSGHDRRIVDCGAGRERDTGSLCGL